MMQISAQKARALLLLCALRCFLAAQAGANETAIMFWRFQKVGSTTLTSMLTSYAMRHQKAVKHRIQGSGFRNVVCQDMFSCVSEPIPPAYPLYYSLWHEACDRVVPLDRLKQMFGVPEVTEIALFRDPVDRAVSAYYFWGEIGVEKHRRRFAYHGNMSSSPPYDMAMSYAANPKFMRGPPGPTFSSTFWAHTPPSSISIMNSRIFVLILERFDESLILLRNHLGWKLADFVHLKLKRAKPHAKAADWPQEAIDTLKYVMTKVGEYTMYDAAKDKFDRQLAAFPGGESQVQKELELLRLMRAHVENRCSDVKQLQVYNNRLKSLIVAPARSADVDADVRYQQSCSYRQMTKEHLMQRLPGGRKRGGLTLSAELRRPDPTKQKATSLFDDHDEMNKLPMFSYYSFPLHASDLCYSCEAHAFEWAMEAGYTPSKLSTMSYADVPSHIRTSVDGFQNCPNN